MGRKFYAALVFILLISVTVVVNSDELDDGDVSEEVGDGPILNEEQSANVEPLDFVTPDPPSNAYFVDSFKDKSGIGKKWILSEAKKDGVDEIIAKYDGLWSIDLPDPVVLKNDYGLIVKTKARHHAIASKLDKPFNFQANKPLIVQYDVKFQNGQDCGGAYVKLLTTEKSSLKNFQDKTPYSIMFGPDKCGLQVKLHFIVKFKNPKNGEIGEHQSTQTDKSLESYFTDKKSHLYALVLNPDGTYKIYVDQKEIASGSLLKNMEPPIVPAKEIDDPNDFKPADWDDKEKIPDPSAKKPEDWDEDQPEKIEDPDAKRPDGWLEDEPEYVPDEKASKPDDWDEDMDGKWEAPLLKNPKCEGAPGCGSWVAPKIKNPLYKGKWKPPMIDNPNFKGKWKPKKIENPNYFETESPFEYLTSIGAVGLELWTMSDGIIFDNFLITDDKNVADNYAIGTWYMKQSAESRVANDEAALRKKTDKPQPDEGEEEEENVKTNADEDQLETAKDADADSVNVTGSQGSPKKSPTSSQRKPNKADLEDDSEEDEVEEKEKSEEEKSQNSSPRRRPRKE